MDDSSEIAERLQQVHENHVVEQNGDYNEGKQNVMESVLRFFVFVPAALSVPAGEANDDILVSS